MNTLKSSMTPAQGKHFLPRGYKRKPLILGSSGYRILPPMMFKTDPDPGEETTEIVDQVIKEFKGKAGKVKDGVELAEKIRKNVPFVLRAFETCKNNPEVARCFVGRYYRYASDSWLSKPAQPEAQGLQGVIDWTSKEYLPILIDALVTGIAQGVLGAIFDSREYRASKM